MATHLTGIKRLRNTEEMKMPIKKRESSNFTFPEHALLVDGVAESRRMEHSLLEALGITTVPMTNAHEAMELLMTPAYYNFIFVDFDLPRINGPEFVRRIRMLGIQSKIVAMCSNFTNENVQMFEAAGANCTISKPVHPMVLSQAIAVLRNNI